MLEVRDLHGGWGPTLVVEGVSLRVVPGECVAIVGRNGVGKSTLLELLAGRARQTGGSVRLAGQELPAGLPPYRRWRQGLGYVPQGREIFPSLTVREHLRIAQRPGYWTREKILELLPRLGARESNLARHLSGGEQQMLAIARALLGNPQLVLMDEPTEGLAPVVVDQLMAVLKAIISANSLAMLLVEQRFDIALGLSNRCLVMERGRVIHEISSGDARAGEDELAALIGLGH
jgi:branched-chain amino acid transport system ATP-binding protein